MLFLLVGMVYDRAHHRWIIFPRDYEKPELAGQPGFGGIGAQVPIYTGFVALAFFAGLGLPALSGFISEAMCFIGGFSAFRTLTIIGTLGILLNAIYFLRAYQRIFLGPLNETYKDLTDINKIELATIVPLAIITLVLGVYPAPLLNMIAPAMDGIIQIVQSAL
jgi:NADH-quinone oxidoreductase subunit M